jgi:hypothetical protein
MAAPSAVYLESKWWRILIDPGGGACEIVTCLFEEWILLAEIERKTPLLLHPVRFVVKIWDAFGWEIRRGRVQDAHSALFWANSTGAKAPSHRRA